MQLECAPRQVQSGLRAGEGAVRRPFRRVLDVRQDEQSACVDIYDLIGRRRNVEVVSATGRFTNEKEKCK
jgi:hypothetical protein